MDDPKSHDSNKPASVLVKAFKTFGYAGSVAVAFLAMKLNVRRASYRFYAGKHRFDTIQAEEETALKAIEVAAQKAQSLNPKAQPEGFIDTIKSNLESLQDSWANKVSTAAEVREVRGEYRKKVKKWYNERGMNNIVDYYKTLSPNDKMEVGLQSATIGGIGAAVTSGIANRDKISRLTRHEEDKSKSSSPDR